jgi:predicted nucleic acid-binding protein
LIYADTDFFLALLKESDWLKEPAERLLRRYAGQICVSPAVLIEVSLLAHRDKVDPERMVEDVLSLATLKGGNPAVFLEAAQLMNEHGAGALDSLHAAFCGQDNRLISSDKVFDRLGLKRIPLEQEHSGAVLVG